jgi:hypothetical protein
MNVIELLIQNGIASNQFQASHIANGLKLYECKTDEERLKRARLYRDWRNSKIYNTTVECYRKAIDGVALPVTPMFGAEHTEIERAADHENVMAMIEAEK